VRGPSDVTNNVYTPLREWAAVHPMRGASIAGLDYGALGYYTEAKIYDFAGLVTPDRFSFGSNAELVEHYKPDYLYLTRIQLYTAIVTDSAAGRSYRPVVRFSTSRDTSLSLDPASVGTEWKHDFVLYKRMTDR
jgi:hypothetical protein